jgi:hypothetical protein
VSTAASEVLVPTGTGTPDLIHLFCGCLPPDAKTAKCGFTKDTWELVGKGIKNAECVVCIDLAEQPCVFCGRLTK